MKRIPRPGSDQETRTPLLWVAHLPKEDQDQFSKSLRNNLNLPSFRRLKDIIAQDLAKLERNSDFDTPNWALKQAYDNGAREYALKIQGLITL